MTAIRIQRKRTKGWRMPEGAIYVDRPTRWGNPFPLAEYALAESLRLYRVHAASHDPDWLDPLRGASALACWCRLDQPCYAAVLIELLEVDR